MIREIIIRIDLNTIDRGNIGVKARVLVDIIEVINLKMRENMIQRVKMIIDR